MPQLSPMNWLLLMMSFSFFMVLIWVKVFFLK